VQHEGSTSADVTSFVARLQSVFGDRLRFDVPMSSCTTFRVGGPADWFVEPRSSEETVVALRLAAEAGVRVTVLGGGSNVLVSDAGLRGLVIRSRGGTTRRIDEARVEADAGVTVNGLVRWTISEGLGGLAAWAGTPGTIGGAVYGNAHYGGGLIGEMVETVTLVSRDGVLSSVRGEDMEFGYDRSRLQRTGEVLLSAVFRLEPGHDSGELRAIARRSLAQRKLTQPLQMPSAGCIFQNPDPARDALPEGVPASAGALIDRAGLKGAAVGGARVSTVHANFIVNEGGATASEVMALLRLCRRRVLERYGVDLRPEVVLLGEFDNG
jgi:UDP-N-acetylmuramate dehydrogenase